MPSEVIELTGVTAREMRNDLDGAANAVDRLPEILSERRSTELTGAVEHFSAAGERDRHTAFRALLECLKLAQDAGRFEDLAQALRLAITPMLDYTSVQSLNQFYKGLPTHVRSKTKIRVAILGGFTTYQLRELIELYLFAAGVSAEIYRVRLRSISARNTGSVCRSARI